MDIVEFLKRLPPEIAGSIMAMFIAFLRILNDENETRPIRILLESLLCGALSLTVSYGILALGLNINWAVFAGGSIGYFGSATVRLIALKFVNKKIDKK